MAKENGESFEGIQFSLEKADRRQNILTEAYSPLGNNIYNLPRAVDDPDIVALAKDLNRQPAQLLISWAVQRGTAVLPKSITESRIKDNFQGKSIK
jgi:L-glyceraldehyde reductase